MGDTERTKMALYNSISFIIDIFFFFEKVTICARYCTANVYANAYLNKEK